MAINDPIFHYTLDGTYGDLWFYTTDFVTDGTRQAMRVDGNADAALLPVAVASTPIGLSVWYKKTPILATYGYILGTESGDHAHLVVRKTDGMIGVYEAVTPTFVGFTSSGVTVNDDEWNNFSVSRDGVNVKVWMNKTLILDVNLLSATPANFRGIGNKGTTNSRANGAYGLFMEVYGFSHTLTQTDVNDLYALNAPPAIPKADFTVTTAMSAAGSALPSPPSASFVGSTSLSAKGSIKTFPYVFRFVQEIQGNQTKKSFRLIQSIAQPKTSTVITRTNV